MTRADGFIPYHAPAPGGGGFSPTPPPGGAGSEEKIFTVYRCYDDYDILLYVGSTGVGLARIGAHNRKAWWPSVRRVEVEHFPSEKKALAHERHLIENLGPLHNILHQREGGRLGLSRRLQTVRCLDIRDRSFCFGRLEAYEYRRVGDFLYGAECRRCHACYEIRFVLDLFDQTVEELLGEKPLRPLTDQDLEELQRRNLAIWDRVT